MKQSALFTDFYSLTMAQGFFKNKMSRECVFEMFFRKHPSDGGFSIFAGLDPLLEKLASLSFSTDDIAYLESLGLFEKDFLDYLAAFRFSGSVHSMDEGEVVFPQEPLVRVAGNLIECQIIEGLLLNTVNFQSLIATKAARVALAARGTAFMEFGLRRAQGEDGAISATRAAIIGGAKSTSNVLGAKKFGVRPAGTMAHSWVMAFPSEEEAFAEYARIYPEHPVFLIDTYDTLKKGLPSAIKVGKKIAENGGTFGVRLDSGDLYYLASEVRKALDGAGLQNATITVSNDLDESIIEALVKDGAPIDSWGVGTRMVTGGGDSAFTGVYKLASFEQANGGQKPVMKFSDHPDKTTNPGVKNVFRLYDDKGAQADIMALDGEELEVGKRYAFWHPQADYRHFYFELTLAPRALLSKKMENGKIVSAPKNILDIRENTLSSLAEFDETYKRQLNPHVYKVSATSALRDLKLKLIEEHLK